MDEAAIRPAVANDRETLWEFLAMATYEPDAAAAKAVPMVATYLDGWQRPQDFGFIAESDGACIGAIWARQFEPAAEPGYYRQDRTPEMATPPSATAQERPRSAACFGTALVRKPSDRETSDPGSMPLFQRGRSAPK